MSDENNNPTVVVDNGSGIVKAGFAGDDAPRSVFPTVIGKPKMPGIMVGMDQKDSYVGDEAIQKRGVLVLKEPIERGFVNNWDDMEKVWHHAFQEELKVAPEEHNVLLTEPPANTRDKREKMTEIMFETFNVRCFQTKISSVLALIANGKTCGMVVESGEGQSSCVPIQECYALPHAVQMVDTAGRDLTTHLKDVLNAKGQQFSTPAEMDIVNDIKEKLCQVNPDRDDTPDAQVLAQELPDGNVLTLAEERQKCLEPLFEPQILNKSSRGLHQVCQSSIMMCDVDIRPDLYSNIILSGGNTLFANFDHRLKRELKTLKLAQPEVFSPAERQFSVWIGGSIMASSTTFEMMCISKQEYDANGPSIVHRKCF